MIMFTAMAIQASQTVTLGFSALVKCYPVKKTEYKDYLHANFDGISISMPPLAQMYTTSKSNNEVYNMKDILQQPDKETFKEAMHKKASAIFKDRMWTPVPKKESADDDLLF